LTKGVRSSEGVVVVRSVGTQFDEVKVVTWKVKSNLREVALGYALRLKMHHVISLELGPSFRLNALSVSGTTTVNKTRPLSTALMSTLFLSSTSRLSIPYL
jgi:hypothetical protein